MSHTTTNTDSMQPGPTVGACTATLELRDLAPDPREEWQRLLNFVRWGADDHRAAVASVEPLFRGPVVFVSMELTDVDLAVRLVSVTNIRKETLVTGALRPEQAQRVLATIERLSRSRLHIVFGSGYTSADVRAYSLQVQATEGSKPALIVVDYVQLLRDEEGDGRLRERNVSAAARGLKDLSGELGVPVFALVQLNRNRATRIDKRPQLADLRESGDLENTADSVLGLYRDEIDQPESGDRGLAELSVLKKRQLGEDVGQSAG